MKTLVFPIILSFCILFSSFAQQLGPNISFEKETHSFGKIPESQGLVSYTFNFTNTGSEPLIIQNVQATCGCTTPEWSREPIKPGEKGFIKATFNPAGRPGPFEKGISITNNSPRNLVSLKISGEVIGKEPTLTDLYPFDINNLRFNTVYASFAKLSPGKTGSRILEVINTGKEALTVSFPSVPAHLKVVAKPSVLQPKQKGIIEIIYDAQKKNDWGFVTDVLTFNINGKPDSKNRITLSGTIEDDYSKASPEQLALAPKITLDKNSSDFGKIKAGTSVELVYNFKNTGKTNLEIHKISPTCGCTIVKKSDKTIKPGASSSITTVFNSAGQKGVINKAITLITNDPKNLNLILWVRGSVE